MSKTQPFIPRDKPKFWVICVLAGLCGLGAGLLAFGASWLQLTVLSWFFMAIFFVCWSTFVISWIGFISGLLSGRYRGITEKPWREQVW